MGDSVHFIINATNLQGAAAGQIHSGSPGENGPIAITRFKFDSPQNEVNMESMFAADKIEGPMQGKQISKLVTATGNWGTHVNVHTGQNPNGEISVQISCWQ